MRKSKFNFSVVIFSMLGVIFSGHRSINSQSKDTKFGSYLISGNRSGILRNGDYYYSGRIEKSKIPVDKVRALLHTLPISTLREIKAVAKKDIDMGRRYIMKMLPKQNNNPELTNDLVSEGTSKLTQSSFIDSIMEELRSQKESVYKSLDHANVNNQQRSSQSSSPILMENFEIFRIPSEIFLHSMQTSTTTEKPAINKYLIFDHVDPSATLRKKSYHPIATTPLPIEIIKTAIKIDKSSDFNYPSDVLQNYKWEDWPSQPQQPSSAPPNHREHYNLQVEPHQNPYTPFHQVFPQQTGSPPQQVPHGPGGIPPGNQISWNQQPTQTWSFPPTTTTTTVGGFNYGLVDNNQQLRQQPQPIHFPPSHQHQGIPQQQQPQMQQGEQPGQVGPYQWPQQFFGQPNNNFYNQPYNNGPVEGNYNNNNNNNLGWLYHQSQYFDSNGWPSPYNQPQYQNQGWKAGSSEEDKKKSKKHGLFHDLHKAIFGDKHNKGKGGKHGDKDKSNENDIDLFKQFHHHHEESKKGEMGANNKGSNESYDNTEASDTYADTYNTYSKAASSWWDKAKAKVHDHFHKKHEDKKKGHGHHPYSVSQKILGISISILAFIAFFAYILMLLFQTAVQTITFPLLSGIIALLSGDGGAQLAGYFIGRSLDGQEGILGPGAECDASELECHILNAFCLLKDIILRFNESWA